MGPGRHEKSVAQLARIAKARADEMRGRLAELDRAKAEADAALLAIDDEVAAEEPNPDAPFETVKIFRVFAGGAGQRRAALARTGATLAGEVAAMRADLAEAYAELKKLEHLLETARRAAVRRSQRAEAASLDALAAMRR